MGQKDRLILQYLHRGLPLKNRPYQEIAKKINISEEELFRRIKSLKEQGIIQRLGTILNHYRSGYSVNAMVVWQVPSRLISKTGKIMSEFPAVSHCYQRKTWPNWPYNLYTMIHARSKSECAKIIRKISGKTGIKQYEALYTMKEYKKKSFDPSSLELMKVN